MTKSARVSIRLEDEIQREVDRLAREERRALSAVLRDLIEEAVRTRRCPGILFAHGPAGRRAVIAGTGLEVWEVVAAYRECEEDVERLQAAYDWLTPSQLRNALGYARIYRDEIEGEIERQRELDKPEAERRYGHLFPQHESRPGT